MCRTLRGGRAEAIITFTPADGRHLSAAAARSETFFERSSSVPSKSMATSLIAPCVGTAAALLWAGFDCVDSIDVSVYSFLANARRQCYRKNEMSSQSSLQSVP